MILAQRGAGHLATSEERFRRRLARIFYLLWTWIMKNRKHNAEQIWKHIEDVLVPRLGLSVIDRAVYSHLLRHSRLEGRRRMEFSIAWLARGARLSKTSARRAVRRLVGQGALRLVELGRAGHLVEVRLPEAIGAGGPDRMRAGDASRRAQSVSLEEADFLETRALRQTIHEREGGRCFYCLRRLTGRLRCLDHVVPQARQGRNSYRNLVSCCLECNSQKAARPAEDLLRRHYRERRLTSEELAARLCALDALASGKLPPPLAGIARPQLDPRQKA